MLGIVGPLIALLNQALLLSDERSQPFPAAHQVTHPRHYGVE
ncbi:hypothetical protein ACWDKQ_32230 [Saccharopolyspora sp. NPDC000995]